MKRDWGQIKAILEAIEEDRFSQYVTEYGYHSDDSLLSPQERDQKRTELRFKYRALVLGHVELLLEAGYIRGIMVECFQDEDFESMPQTARPRLTMAGYDLLASLRTPKVWNKLKALSEQMGVEITVDFLKAALPKIPHLLAPNLFSE